jgi:UPF0755 protein
VTRSRWLRVVLMVVGVPLLAAACLALAYLWAERWYAAPIAALETPVVFEIALGEPVGRVAQNLSRRGLLSHPQVWAWFARRSGLAARVRAGEYELPAGASPAALLHQFVEGRVLLHPVTLVEGWTYAAARVALEAHPVLHHELSTLSEDALMARLGATGIAPEGEFYPDTYLVARGTSDLEVLRLAHQRLAEKLAQAWARRRPDLPLATPYEALILASIVEKETGSPEERPRIAAVFVNRLRRGMRLQTDPTVIYGLGAAYDGSLHRRDLTTDTPFNTYTRDGLPPTPIALAGAAALEAAVLPADSDELYFVATGQGDGRHEFSRTIEAHNAAVARYVAARRRLEGARR